MPKHIEVMERREEEIANLLKFISKKTDVFTKPKIITIGGYALRAYIPFKRYTRDCDFIIRKEKSWQIDTIKEWLSNKIRVETYKKEDSYGYLRFIKFILINKMRAKISLDFMEGEVRGRNNEEIVLIDKRLIQESKRIGMMIGKNEIELFVPSYTDYLILKLVSARASDIRDVAALVWKNGIPDGIEERAGEILPHPEIIKKNIETKVVPDISDKRFVNSWRGTFITAEFTDKERKVILKKVKELLYPNL